MQLIRSTRVVLPEGERPASILIDHGAIVAIEPWGATALAERHAQADEVFDAGDLAVSPGIVDTHVHVNEPGRADWEGFDTATRAAAAGGITTIVDMPLNSIPATTTVAALETKRAAADGRVHVDVAFWGGVVPGNSGAIDALGDAGVRGFKCFLAPSGVDEFQHVGEADLRDAMPALARTNKPLLVHAEDPAALTEPRGATYEAFLASRPPDAEREAIRTIVRLAREFGARAHIVHVASVEAIDEIAGAKADRVPLTAETCPHYLFFSAADVPAGATEFKCAPPIRSAAHRDALRHAVKSGVLDVVASDHSPAPAHLKCRGDFSKAWGGIASLELSLAAAWSACADTGIGLAGLARRMSDAPARLAGLERTKGRIAVGCDADLIVWDPDAERVVDPSQLQQRHKLTPYAGRTLRGIVKTTFLRGERVWDDGALVLERRGRLL